MIRELSIRPRAAGKTTYLKALALSLPGHYVDCTRFHKRELIDLITLSSNHTFILDEPFRLTPIFLEWLIPYFDKHDFYMSGTPMSRIQDTHPIFYEYLQTYYPEVLI